MILKNRYPRVPGFYGAYRLFCILQIIYAPPWKSTAQNMKLKRKATNAAYGWTGRHVQNAFMDMIAISIDVKDIDTTRGKLNLHLRSIRHKSMTQRPLIPLIYALFYNYLLVQPPSDLQPPSLSDSSREVGGMRRREEQGRRRTAAAFQHLLPAGPGEGKLFRQRRQST